MLRRYTTFVVVGLFVTIATVAFRAIIGYLLQDDSPLKYTLSIAIAYAFGISLSYLLQRTVTFSAKERPSAAQFTRFIGVHLIGMACTAAGSAVLLFVLAGSLFPGEASKSISFAAAAFAVSVLTYALNNRFVFRIEDVERLPCDG